jgi:hypothetical protein
MKQYRVTDIYIYIYIGRGGAVVSEAEYRNQAETIFRKQYSVPMKYRKISCIVGFLFMLVFNR